MSRRKRGGGVAGRATHIDRVLPPERPTHGVTLIAGICALLVVVVFVAFWGLLSSAFVNYDDNVYVTENARVQRGITSDNVTWAFTTTYFGFYYPMTWLSHMLDCQLYGLDAGRHHLTSLVIHAMNAVLLFLLLLRMTGALWRCALVAGLFALHPLHVESVAWIAERKDVLSTLFWMLTVLAWLGYVRKGSRAAYVLAIAMFALGLMAKSMLVTLPFLLLLLDYWPLGRLVLERGRPLALGSLILEKAPLFVMSAVSCVVTVVAQKSGGAVGQIEAFPVGERFANAALSYVSYIEKTFWPERLAVFYPHPHISLLTGTACGSVLLLAVISGLALVFAKRVPYAVVGWLWYLGALVPVIGLVQAGEQARGDRYTYVSLIGIFIIIAWGLADLCGPSAAARCAIAAALSVSLAALFVVTRIQTSHWVADRDLWQHANAVTSNNYMAENSLGTYCMTDGKTEEAVAHFREAVRDAPGFANAELHLGVALDVSTRGAEALEHFQRALQLDPDSAQTWLYMGLALGKQGRMAEAVDSFQHCLKIAPDLADAHYYLGVAFLREKRHAEAREQFVQAERLHPGFGKAREDIDKLDQILGTNPQVSPR